MDPEILELVLQARDGDREAFGELARRFQPTVFAIALKRLRNSAEACELAQDVFVQAMRKLPQLREPERFAGWLRKITVRMAINRGTRRPQDTAKNPEMFGALGDDGATPLEDLLRREQAAQVWGGLGRLRELDRRTLIAFYIEGQSLIEMSDQFDSPVGTIKRRLHTARNRLREELTNLQPA